VVEVVVVQAVQVLLVVLAVVVVTLARKQEDQQVRQVKATLAALVKELSATLLLAVVVVQAPQVTLDLAQAQQLVRAGTVLLLLTQAHQ
jgi:hypothetical protein